MGTAFPWFENLACQCVLAALQAEGLNPHVVGGAVRDWLHGTFTAQSALFPDLDIAAEAPPQVVMDTLCRAGIRVIPTGLQHGTVTAMVEGTSFEITSLRSDIRTDGRHASVDFHTDWQQDAMRRDFTINAIYLAPSGEVYDPTGGVEDLRAGRVRFIGEAAARLTEDYLRILRFVRFTTRFAQTPDPMAVQACQEHARHLERISGERICAEMLQILPHAAGLELIRTLGLEEMLFGVRLRDLRAAQSLEDPWRCLIALCGGSERAFRHIAPRWRLSRKQVRRLDPDVLWRCVEAVRRYPPRALAHLYTEEQLLDARALVPELVVPALPVPVDFPVTGHDLVGVEGPALGRALEAMRERWLMSDCTLSKAELLSPPAGAHHA